MEQHDDGHGHESGDQAVEEAVAYYASIGPWYSAAGVMEYCAISEETLERWRQKRVVLGVEFADGQYYYPVQQFVDGHPVQGLERVLAALAPAFVAPGSQAGWFASKAYYGSATTRWDLLRQGELELVRGFAEEDVARVMRP